MYEGGTLAAWIYIGIGLVSRTRSDGAQLRGGFPVDRGVILLAGEILTRVVGATPLSVLNHLAGGVLGLCFMMAFISSTEQYGDDRQGIGPDPAPGKGRIPLL
mgnify:CR=1 FL=1